MCIRDRSNTAVKDVAPIRKPVEKQAEPGAVKTASVLEQTPANTAGVSEAGALARMERKRKRAEAAATASGAPLAESEAVEIQSDSLVSLESGANEQTPTLNSGSTEAGMLARMERKRKRAEEAAVATGIPLAQSESVVASEVSLAKSESTESEQTSALNSGSTEAGMLARMERKRKRAEAAANQSTADKSPNSEEPK